MLNKKKASCGKITCWSFRFGRKVLATHAYQQSQYSNFTNLPAKERSSGPGVPRPFLPLNHNYSTPRTDDGLSIYRLSADHLQADGSSSILHSNTANLQILYRLSTDTPSSSSPAAARGCCAGFVTGTDPSQVWYKIGNRSGWKDLDRAIRKYLLVYIYTLCPRCALVREGQTNKKLRIIFRSGRAPDVKGAKAERGSGLHFRSWRWKKGRSD